VERGMSVLVLPHRCVDCGFRFFQPRRWIGSLRARLFPSKDLNTRLTGSNGHRGRELRGGMMLTMIDESTGRAVLPFGPEAQAFQTLGLRANASPGEVSNAYRQLARMYHPDKVAGMAPEFQALAEQRMREINAAYELARRCLPGC